MLEAPKNTNSLVVQKVAVRHCLHLHTINFYINIQKSKINKNKTEKKFCEIKCAHDPFSASNFSWTFVFSCFSACCARHQYSSTVRYNENKIKFQLFVRSLGGCAQVLQHTCGNMYVLSLVRQTRLSIKVRRRRVWLREFYDETDDCQRTLL